MNFISFFVFFERIKMRLPLPSKKSRQIWGWPGLAFSGVSPFDSNAPELRFDHFIRSVASLVSFSSAANTADSAKVTHLSADMAPIDAFFTDPGQLRGAIEANLK